MTTPHSSILVIAATTHELNRDGAWRSVVCGVGPVEASAMTARAISTLAPTAILHLGIAGARRAANIAAPQLVIGSSSIYCDLDPTNRWSPRELETDARLVAAVHGALPEALLRPIGTSARVGGTRDVDVEAMEGFAVLRAAQFAGIPAIEIRAISNEIEEPDRTRWQFEEAFAAIRTVTPHLVEAIARCVS